MDPFLSIPIVDGGVVPHRFLDMCRTAVNVGGDLVIAALVGARAPRASSP